MSVDYGMEVVYGFKLDRDKLKESFQMRKQMDEDFDEYAWVEEICEASACEFVRENCYCGIGDSDIYFGVVFYNRITAETLAELEHDRREYVCDELVRIFGNYDILDREQIEEPELHAVAQIW